MTARYMEIVGRTGPAFGELASLKNFTTTPGAAVDVETLIHRPHVSLYCLDDETRQAVFVELPEEVELRAAAFIFDTQLTRARRLILVPYSAFTQAAARLPALQRLVLIYMTGRSGSTLLSHALNEFDSVVSLSEADTPSQFVYLRGAYQGREAELAELLDATLRFLCRPASQPPPVLHALKLRPEALQAIDLFQSACPWVKNLFLYRDAVGWVASFYRLLNMHLWPDTIPLQVWRARRPPFNLDTSQLLPYLGEAGTHVAPVEALTLTWLGLMQTYLDAQRRGVPMLAVRYCDLNANPRQVLAAITRYCGLGSPLGDRGLSVFERDSQAGTSFRRDKPSEGNPLRFTAEQLQQITAILRRHPLLSESDIAVPGTLHIGTPQDTGLQRGFAG